MSISSNFDYIVVRVEDKDDYIKLYNHLRSNLFNKSSFNSLEDDIRKYPNYILINVKTLSCLFLSNNRDNMDYQDLKEIIFDSVFKAYPVVFTTEEDHLRRIINILNWDEDIIRPSYKPKKIVKENTEYKYNGWVIFKVYNDDEYDFVVDNLDINENLVNLYDYPGYLFYNLTVKKLLYLSKGSDEEVYNFIEKVEANKYDNYRNIYYVIPHIFGYKDVLKLDKIRGFGLIKPSYEPRKISKLESFLNEEIEPMLMPDWENLGFSIKDEEYLKSEYIKQLGKKGELLDYVKKGKTKLTFGILRSLFNDAIAYKKKREMTKGLYKFVHRIVPIALAVFWFPVWVLAQILGGSRALNKILIPVLKMNPSNYKSFLVTLITKTMDLMEGEIKTFMGDDWYYRVFMVDWGLIKMIRKEHIYNFALHAATVMENEPDEKIVPTYYIENEMRKWLNDTFTINPPIPIKTDEIITESVDYSYIKKFLD